MSYFQSFDDLFKSVYCVYHNWSDHPERRLQLQRPCEDVILGYDMDVIEELFRMHVETSTDMITPIDLQANIMCLREVGKLPALQ